MSHPQRDFVQYHSHTLAALWLSRRPDLRGLDQNGEIFGADLLVAVEKDGRFTGRQFGAVVKGYRAGSSAPRLTARELRRERERFADQTFPVCMLAFPASGEPGWFRWIVEPGGCDGCTGLHFSDCIGFEPATDELLGRVVSQVSQWFDARRGAAGTKHFGER
ncbi:MAG TPA: hypothetical protein VFJ82_06910 [Longimicrobium sp.]|nr:hypothetical protein [Longimicrobium sp.]